MLLIFGWLSIWYGLLAWFSKGAPWGIALFLLIGVVLVCCDYVLRKLV